MNAVQLRGLPGMEQPRGRLARALALAAVLLPKRMRSWRAISRGIAFKAAAELEANNCCEDEILLGFLWLLPECEAEPLLPAGRTKCLKNLRAFWPQVHPALKEGGEALERLTVFVRNDMLPAERIIAATYLRILSESGTAGAPQRGPEEESFLRNLLTLAGVFAVRSPDLSGDRLWAEVMRLIGRRGLKAKLLPEEAADEIWTFALRPEVPAEAGAAALQSLRRFLSRFWLAAAESRSDERTSAVHLLLEEQRGETGAEGASIGRLIAAIAARFPRVFVVRKEEKAALKRDIAFRRTEISSWHGGLGYQGKYKALLHAQSADPLDDFIKLDAAGTLEEELQRIEKLSEA